MKQHRIILLLSFLLLLSSLLNAQNPLPKGNIHPDTTMPDELPNGKACTVSNEYNMDLIVQKEGEGMAPQSIILRKRRRTTIRLNDCGHGNCDVCQCNYTLKIGTEGKKKNNQIALKPGTRYIVRYRDKEGWGIEEYSR